MKAESKRLDHQGIVCGVIDDLGITETVDDLVGNSGLEEVTLGEVVKGCIMNGLGFGGRALMGAPQFFDQLPLDELFDREGVEANHFNRHRISRALDQIHEFGCEKFFGEISRLAVASEDIDISTVVLDTTSYSFTGNYEGSADSLEEIKVEYGYSKDHRPDLKQVVQELIVSHDGGVPLVFSCKDGSASDNKTFAQRTKAIQESICGFDDGMLIADSKLYSSTNAENLEKIKFLTRIPNSIGLAKELVDHTISNSNFDWQKEGTNGYFCAEYGVKHNGMKQKWFVVFTHDGVGRACKSLEKSKNKQLSSLRKKIKKMEAKHFKSYEKLDAEVSNLNSEYSLYDLSIDCIVEGKKYKKRGRPTKNDQDYETVYSARINVDDIDTKEAALKKACFVLGTNDLSMTQDTVLTSYQRQGHVERGFKFLKDSLFFSDRLFLKKESRIEALICLMTLSLLIYSIGQRRLRKALQENDEAVDNLAGIAEKQPTLRSIFSRFTGINIIKIWTRNQVKSLIQGFSDFHRRIVSRISQRALYLYNMYPAT